jgi:hypothetical protein
MKKFLLTLLVLAGTSCLQTSTKSVIALQMLGVYTAPTGATGAYDPLSETFTVVGVTMTAEDGTVTDLMQGQTVSPVVIDRNQIVFSADILSSYIGQTFNTFTVTLASAATATSEYSKGAAITISPTVITYNTPFTFSKSQGVTFVIQVEWSHTVTRSSGSSPTDTISSPGFQISFTNS